MESKKVMTKVLELRDHNGDFTGIAVYDAENVICGIFYIVDGDERICLIYEDFTLAKLDEAMDEILAQEPEQIGLIKPEHLPWYEQFTA